ncbi:MAG: AAA family ATPase [Candidatus Thiodiazotropha sp. 6PLUC2]
MIENITIRNVASYSEEGQVLSGLSNNNFFYGSNGTGKTTISKIIDNEDDYPDSTITWRGGNKIDAFVYNRDFVSKNFNLSSELKGIFTLGETDPKIIEKIKTTNTEIETLEEEIIKLRRNHQGDDGGGGKIKEKSDLDSSFETKCWTYKTMYDSDFKDAFKGVRDKKLKFKDRVISESESNKEDLLELEELKNKATTVFSESLKSVSLIPEPSFQDLVSLESSSVLSKKIVGKDDIDLADLIKKLNNSDWVRKGMEYLDESGEKCPFCQQSIEQSLYEELSEYFDKSYIRGMESIKTFKINYSSYSRNLLEVLKEILGNPPEQLEVEKLKTLNDLLSTKITANIQHIERKANEASAVISLEPLGEVLQDISDLISNANKIIGNHNSLVENIEKEKKILTLQVWRFVCNEIKADYDEYKSKNTALQKAIDGLKAGIKTKEDQVKIKDTERQELEKDITSIQPTIDEINALLKSFGFEGFKLDKSEKKGFYKIVRSDGSVVEDTLSEGEKSFITFLYFYHLLKGSNQQDSITKPRVVVFDDPVSSLDSDILFIVSNLIKGIFEEIRNQEGSIKQVFVLTHNVFFHKEVSFNQIRSNGVMNEETFWIVKKSNEQTYIEKQNENPIMTSYELLWKELKSDNISNLTIQNILRRILENYFKILGNIDKDDIINMFEGKEKLICASLFAWINNGSHFANDDLYISTDDATVQQYLDVFKGIFQKSNHIEHYNMMMGDSELPTIGEGTNDNAEENPEVEGPAAV